MSNLFKKDNLGKIFSELNSETSVSLPKYLNVKNINSSDNVSNFLPQKGGSFGLKSANKNTDDQVNQLISMLTSESEDKHNFSANSTVTEVLENRLRNMLQDGGAKKKKYKKQRGGAGESDEELKAAYRKLKEAGFNVKLNDKPAEQYFGQEADDSSLSALFLSPKQASVKSLSAPKVPSVHSIVDTGTSTDFQQNNMTDLLNSKTSSAQPSATRLPSASRNSIDSITCAYLPSNINVDLLAAS